MAFISCTQGNLKDVFITEAEIIDRFVGNQLWAWGLNSTGQLGNSSTINRSSPVQTVSSGINWQQVSIGADHSAAIKTDGTLWLWGFGDSGRLGNNSSINRSSPVQTVSNVATWKQVSAGGIHSAAIKTDGTLWLWGSGAGGVLGANFVANRSSPVQTSSATNSWKQVSLGCIHSAAIKTDGTLWIWGCNSTGLLGDNTSIDKSSPVQTVSQTTDWKQISLGRSQSAAIKTDGTLWLWGCGAIGQLGNNSTLNRSSPVQTISTGTSWKQVSVGGFHSAAIKTDGTLWLWGCNQQVATASGQLGNNSSINLSSPVQTVSSGINWKQVSLGFYQSAAIKTDGTLWLWGLGDSGRLGNNSSINRSSPVQTISTGTSWKQVSSGGSHSSAITFTEL